MNESSPGPDTMSRLAAAAAAAIVAAGLVTAPQTSNVTVPRAVPTIQLQNLAVELTAAARQISTETTAPTQIAAATPQANQSGLTVNNLLQVALSIVAVPLWYAAFPSTLTISLIRAFVATYSSGYCARCRGFIEVGLTDFVLSPLNQVRKALEALVPQSISAAAASDSRSAAQVSSVPQAPRRAPGTTRGLAGSKRTATVNPNAGRTAQTPKAAKSTPKATQTKHPGAAGSARGTSKTAPS
ncbi:hypothetical protein H7J51_20485 [Mycobacterium crocinum]|uniref:Uncharacterized protein n=1 Tax=Mycolicibacterium crocinum TaxID=388459 RepID=A0ABY3TQB3_9MYCO|nr:hypothetical protein [Mycolicibacterium crocinum]MCV7217659.1 hypothetical protein [Mycolicibacterium crocinum]ULN42531.1 hypothetical protein MI149_05275 [Mycolicibacterium crocinum]